MELEVNVNWNSRTRTILNESGLDEVKKKKGEQVIHIKGTDKYYTVTCDDKEQWHVQRKGFRGFFAKLGSSAHLSRSLEGILNKDKNSVSYKNNLQKQIETHDITLLAKGDSGDFFKKENVKTLKCSDDVHELLTKNKEFITLIEEGSVTFDNGKIINHTPLLTCGMLYGKAANGTGVGYHVAATVIDDGKINKLLENNPSLHCGSICVFTALSQFEVDNDEKILKASLPHANIRFFYSCPPMGLHFNGDVIWWHK